MTRSTTRRAAILEQLADHVLAHGLSASSLRPLAGAAGLSDRMLLYYFKDKAEVMTAVLETVAARMTVALGTTTAPHPLPFAALRTQLAAAVLADTLWPYMQLWLEVAALSARGDSFYRAVGERIGRGFLAWGAAQLDSASEAERAAEAAALLVTTEGLVLLKSLGLADVGALAVGGV